MNKGIGKIVGIVLVVMVGIYIFTLLAPLGVVLGAIGIWYFTKKAPDKGMENASISLLAISVIFVAFGGSEDEVETENAASGAKTVETATAESVIEEDSEEEQESKLSAEEQAEADAQKQDEAQMPQNRIGFLPMMLLYLKSQNMSDFLRKDASCSLTPQISFWTPY